MKSLIIGANGGVGQHLVRKLKARDVDFTAGVRKEEQVEALKADGIDATYIDVAKQSIDELIEKLHGQQSEVSGFKACKVNCAEDIQKLPLAFESAKKALTLWLSRK